ncbi:hypothetical protein [Novosphingobium sp. PC22D]|uniref:hypothetical protein n=1 Tax=Novosphingobium sp. PC22D TaxID=1962403 RepID=UPI000BF0FE6A|nr:hypothetical protein [Novosphingobium sp. PC22D]
MNALMTDFDINKATEVPPQRWEGFAEIDQAIREDRLMQYRLRKSWADPWGRKLTIFCVTVIFLGFAFLAGAQAGLW